VTHAANGKKLPTPAALAPAPVLSIFYTHKGWSDFKYAARYKKAEAISPAQASVLPVWQRAHAATRRVAFGVTNQAARRHSET